MAWSGSGTFTRAITSLSVSGSGLWAAVKALSGHNTIRSDDHDLHDQDLATGIDACLAKNGENAMTGNLNMGSNRITAVAAATARTDAPRVAQIQDGGVVYAADGGSANTYTLTLAPAITAYAAGQVFWSRIATANTGASTLNVNAVGAKAIRRRDNSALLANDLIAGQIAGFAYDATSDNFELLTPVGQPMGLVRNAQSANYTLLATDIGALVDFTSAVTATLTAAATVGAGYYVTIRNSSTGQVTISGTVDSLTNLILGPLQSITVYSDGSNYKSISGTNLGRQTIGAPLQAWTATTTSGATSVTLETGANDNMVVGFRFLGSGTEKIQLFIPAPHGADDGKLNASFTDHMDSGSSATAIYALEALAFGSGDALDLAFGSAESAALFHSAASAQYEGSITNVTVANAGATKKWWLVQFSRVGGHSSDNAGSTVVRALKLFYRINRQSDEAA